MLQKGIHRVYGAALLSSMMLLTGCWGLNRLETTAIEQELEIEIESQGHRLSLREVRCPDTVYRQAEAYFRCVGYLRPEGEFTIHVTQTDHQGNIEWQVPNSEVILNLAKVEAQLQAAVSQAFSRRATLDCGDLYRPNQPGDQFTCQVVGGIMVDDQTRVTALVVSITPQGNLNWYEVRQPLAPVASASSAASGQTAAAPTAATPEATRNREAAQRGVAGSRMVKSPIVAP